MPTKDFQVNGGSAVIRLNSSLYSLDVIYAVSYVLLEKAYIILDGDAKKEILVIIKPRRKDNLKELVNEFYDKLIDYSFYKSQSEKNADIRKQIIERALLTNLSDVSKKNEGEEVYSENYAEDIQGIAIPWEEKYGDKNDNKNRK